jgi:hypothetical protein
MARSSRVLLFVQLSSLVARADTSASTPKRNCRSSVRQARNHALSSSGGERHAARVSLRPHEEALPRAAMRARARTETAIRRGIPSRASW